MLPTAMKITPKIVPVICIGPKPGYENKLELSIKLDKLLSFILIFYAVRFINISGIPAAIQHSYKDQQTEQQSAAGG